MAANTMIDINGKVRPIDLIFTEGAAKKSINYNYGILIPLIEHNGPCKFIQETVPYLISGPSI